MMTPGLELIPRAGDLQDFISPFISELHKNAHNIVFKQQTGDTRIFEWLSKQSFTLNEITDAKKWLQRTRSEWKSPRKPINTRTNHKTQQTNQRKISKQTTHLNLPCRPSLRLCFWKLFPHLNNRKWKLRTLDQTQKQRTESKEGQTCRKMIVQTLEIIHQKSIRVRSGCQMIRRDVVGNIYGHRFFGDVNQILFGDSTNASAISGDCFTRAGKMRHSKG